MHFDLKTLEGVATVVIAAYVASIGTFQWKIAREKLRLDLYNRRFEVYLAALDFMQALMSWTSIPADDRHAKRAAFNRASRESQFLFADNPRIFALLEEFQNRSYKVIEYDYQRPFAQEMPVETLMALGQKTSSMDWIMDSITQFESMLMPYLAFPRHRSKKTKAPR